jgi:DNA-binding XRE family transcriptional regulator
MVAIGVRVASVCWLSGVPVAEGQLSDKLGYALRCWMELSPQERAFAAEVERCRAAAGVKQDWVARQVGLSRPKISEICRGRFLPSRQVLEDLVIALAMDRERAVELWHAAREAREGRRHSERMLSLPAPTGWSALPVLPAEVLALLRAQEEAAVYLPYRLHGARTTSLATVYVRQHLGSGMEEPQPEQPRAEPVRDGRVPLSLPEPPAPRLTVRPPSRTLRAALDGDDHLLVTGGPGQGKSTMSLRLAAEIAATWRAPTTDEAAPLAEPVIPVRLTARELATRLGLPGAQALAASIMAEYGSLMLRFEVGTDVLGGKVGGCRWLLLVDGLDEIANGAERDQLVKVLGAWASGPDSPYRIVLTTRPVEGAALAPFQRAAAARYELQPFDEEALARFAENWFAEEGSDTAARFVRQIRHAHLDELVQVPLLATIAAIIFSQHDDLPLPDNEYELYEAYLSYLRPARPAARDVYERMRIPLLELLGWVRFTTDKSLIATAHGWFSQQVSTQHRSANWQEELVTFLTSTGPLELRGDELRFMHHSFAEHLAATFTARTLPEMFDADAFVHLLHASRQEIRGRHARVVLVHYTRLRPTEADRLVHWLHEGAADDHLLAARLLAKHVPANAEVVDDFLATARSWAMTTQYPSWDILDSITRATHHPGLVPWLVNLQGDEQAPWRSRVAAAIALATRLDAEKAAEFLRTVLHDEDVPIVARLDAAEGLSDYHTSYREIAEQGLRLVLADPSVPAGRRRTATVVLAGLSPAAHSHAVASLQASLADPWTSMEALVQSASALTEIGLEFHEQCADVFRAVLATTREWSDVRSAALGLAALGPSYLSEAADVLIAFARNRRNDYFYRAPAAKELHDLGPQFRATGAGLVLEMLNEPSTEFYERCSLANTLAGLGSDFHAQAAERLRVLANMRGAQQVSNTSIADGLVELGPDYHAEAAAMLKRVVDDPLSDRTSTVFAVGRLAKLGPAHREFAARWLRQHLEANEHSPDHQVLAAAELTRLGPEFHQEVTNFLSATVATAQPDAPYIGHACSTLLNLGTEHRELCAKTLAAAFRSPSLDLNLLNSTTQLASLGPVHRQEANELLREVIEDPIRSDRIRLLAALRLARLDARHEREAFAELMAVLCQPGGPDIDRLPGFSALGNHQRHELAGTMCELLSDPCTGPERALTIAKAVAQLSRKHVPRAVEVLADIMADKAAKPFTRFDAAEEYVALRPARTADAVAATADSLLPANLFWTLRAGCLTLAGFGHDATPLVRGVLAEHDTERSLRQESALLLTDLEPSARDETVAELRRQVADECLDDKSRGELLMDLVELESVWVDEAVAFHKALLDDPTQPTQARCEVAWPLAVLDRTLWSHIVATVRGLAFQPFATATDRHAVTHCLIQLRAMSVAEEQTALAMLVRDPRLDPRLRHATIPYLEGAARLDAQRRQLADHTCEVDDRVPTVNAVRDSTILAREATTALRDVLTAPEFSPEERVAAADALASLSVRLMPDAVNALMTIANSEGSARFAALRALGWLDGSPRRTALSVTESLVTDESLPARQRRHAAELLMDLEYAPKPFLLDYLRAIAQDPTVAGTCRVNTLYALRHVDGPSPLRELRDDECTTPAVRAQAAEQLVGFTSKDQAAAVQLLGHIANEPTIKAALRVRAAQALTDLGTTGRHVAIDTLVRIAADTALPTTARAYAAEHLAETCPPRRGDAVRILRELQHVANPFHRIQVLRILGILSPEEATYKLADMTEDTALGPVARLRSAEALADLRHDHHETAAVTARQLMTDDNVPWHIRRHAARDLARWSTLCRQEARNFLRAD